MNRASTYDFSRTIHALEDAADELRRLEDVAFEAAELETQTNKNPLRCERCGVVDNVRGDKPAGIRWGSGEWLWLCIRCTQALQTWLKG